jgi:hypothetical protein
MGEERTMKRTTLSHLTLGRIMSGMTKFGSAMGYFWNLRTDFKVDPASSERAPIFEGRVGVRRKRLRNSESGVNCLQYFSLRVHCVGRYPAKCQLLHSHCILLTSYSIMFKNHKQISGVWVGEERGEMWAIHLLPRDLRSNFMPWIGNGERC